MADQLAPFPLTERSVHLCVDVQRIFSADGLWPSPWMERVLPVITALARLHPERSVFTRFIPPERPEQMPACGNAIIRAGELRPARTWIRAC